MVGQMYEARIRQIDLAIAILAEDLTNLNCRLLQLEGYLKYTRHGIFDNDFGSAFQVSQQVTSFSNCSLACNQWSGGLCHRVSAPAMKTFVAIQEGNDHASIQKHRFHRPKPFKCDLLEPKSGAPEANLPRPRISRFPLPSWL